MNVMDNGASLRDIANGFIGSAEFQSAYGENPSNSQLIDKFYQNVLPRPGEAGGFAYWLNVLDTKAASVADVLAGFSESTENQAGLIGVIGNGFSYTPFG